jgi:hypothetical protein
MAAPGETVQMGIVESRLLSAPHGSGSSSINRLGVTALAKKNIAHS